MRKNQEPTCVSLVHEALVQSNDFKTTQQLQQETECLAGRICAALCHLRAHKAVDFISDVNGTWWFATQESDNRLHKMDLRAPEVKPRKPRKSKKAVLK